MRKVFSGSVFLGVALVVHLATSLGMAEEKTGRGQINPADFTPAYLEEIQAEKNGEIEKQKLLKEHDKFLRDIARTDHFAR